MERLRMERLRKTLSPNWNQVEWKDLESLRKTLSPNWNHVEWKDIEWKDSERL
jgi:hypothetical protein